MTARFDCVLWRPLYWSHSQCMLQYLVFLFCYAILCSLQSPHLNKNISSMLGRSQRHWCAAGLRCWRSTLCSLSRNMGPPQTGDVSLYCWKKMFFLCTVHLGCLFYPKIWEDTLWENQTMNYICIWIDWTYTWMRDLSSVLYLDILCLSLKVDSGKTITLWRI